MDYLKTNITFIYHVDKLPLLADFFKRKKEFCWDLETTVTDEVWDRRIRTMSFGDMEEQYVVDLLVFTNDLRGTQGFFSSHLCYKPLLDVIGPVLDSREWLKIGYNLEFEYVVTRWCLGIWSWRFFCSFNAEKVLLCGHVSFKIKGFWGLDDALKRYFGVTIDKALQKSFDLTTPLTEPQITYAALDVSLPKLLKDTQVEQLEKHKLLPTIEIENNAIPAFGEQHLNGIKLDVNEWKLRIEELHVKKLSLLADLDRFFIPVCGIKALPELDLDSLEKEWRDTIPDKNYRKTLNKAQKTLYDEEVRKARAVKKAVYSENSKRITEMCNRIADCEGEALINYNSPMQLLETLPKLGVPKDELPDTNAHTLSRLASKYAVIKTITDFRGVKKLEGTYGQPFLNHISSVTGRIHSHCHQIGAETGRASSTRPNIYNLPQGEEWRRGFIAESGYKIITTDYAGQELRILAEVSQEPVWLKAFRLGWDVHSVVAELIFGDDWRNGFVKDSKCNGVEVLNNKGQPTNDCAYYFDNKKKCDCPKHKKLRNNVKSINFGIAYGMTENKLSEELGITRGDARLLLDSYYRAVKTLKDYLDKSGKFAKLNYKAFTIGGRVRYFKAPTREYAIKLLIEDGIKKPTWEEISRKEWSLKASIEREGKNSVIQGSGADMLKLALGCGFDDQGKPYLWHVLRRQGAKLVNNVYDEIVVECAENQVSDLGPIISERMCTAAGVFVKTIPFETEQHVENHWQK
jgi:DNA polymerase I-like protein with 3'-5' exonuclease and polymerase domains